MTDNTMTRRSALTLVVSGLLVPTFSAWSNDRPLVQVYKDPSCGCCGAWVEHVAAAGYQTSVEETADVSAIKTKRGVPETLWSCHTAVVDGYVLEGHVPAPALARLLAERPSAAGLAVPGMPTGSPGMEVAGVKPDEYDVVLFGKDGSQRTFMRFRGAAPI